MSIPSVHGRAPGPPLSVLIRETWFLWPLGLRVLAWIFLAHTYEIAVFQDASWQMLAGQGVYARFSPWLSSAGDGYYAAPPLYAYMLWVSGRVAAVLGGHWWLHQLLIKSWLLLADLGVMTYLLRRSPAAARSYWTMWFVPVVAIGQVQPDLWIGLCLLAALHLALQERWIVVGLLLGVGAGFKPLPLLILPFLLVYLIRAGRPKAVAPVGLGVVGALVLGWLPYVLAFPDARQFAEVIRFHATRPIAGLTIPSGILLIVNAGLAALQLVGIQLSWAEAAYDGVVRAGVAYPAVTLGAFAVLLGIAVRGRPWSLPQTFCLPLLAFLAANKVVHEHYILQVLPLLVALGMNLRGTAIAFSVYLLAAGGPLRFFPSEFGLPSAVEVLLPPLPGAIASIGLAIAAGMAALAFGRQILRLLATAGGAAVSMTAYDAAWDIGMKIIKATRRIGTPGLERLLERVGTRIIPAPQSDLEVSVVDGIRLVVPAGLPSARTYARGGYEVSVTQLVRRLARPGMTLVDVGAFCGYYALLFSYLTGEEGVVYAFEPHPDTFQYLLRNIRRNNRANVTAVNMAITGTSGWGHLTLHRWSDHHWVASGVGEPSGIDVQTVAMDDFFRSRGWPRIDLIKLDVEGAEHAVLQGMREVSRRNPQLQVIMELDHSNLRRAGTTWAETAATLQELGFRTGRVIEQDLRSFSLDGPAPANTTCNILVTRD